MTMLTLRIDPDDPPPGGIGRWFVEGRLAGEPITVVGQAARSMEDLSQRFLRLFEQGGPAEQKTRPFTEPEALRALGRQLFATWFEPAWPAIKAQLASTDPHQLVVQSSSHFFPPRCLHLDGVARRFLFRPALVAIFASGVRATAIVRLYRPW